jgi:hypothetical protein
MRIVPVLALLACVFSASAAEAARMTFRPLEIGDCRKSCSKVLLGEGVIARDSYKTFQAALRRVGRNTQVLLHSPGGNLAGGLLLGIAFRESGAKVAVAPGGGCFSACAYAMLGGVNRKVYSGGQYGVHEFSEPDRKPGYVPTARDKAEEKEIQAILRRYTKEMGVSPELIGMANRIRHDNIRVLSSKELSRMRVVTGR